MSAVSRNWKYLVHLLVVMILVGTIFAMSESATGADWSISTANDATNVYYGGILFTQYLEKSGAKPILWPIIGPGKVLMTRGYPMKPAPGEKDDHVHQRSFWFTHGSVNDIDFWSENDRHGSIVHRQYQQQSASGAKATIRTVNDWLGPDGARQCEDVRTLTFSSEGDDRIIDFDVAIKATDGPVKFGDTKEGSFGIRVPTVMDVNSKMGGRIVNSEGNTDGDAWGKRAAWVDYHGPVDGNVVGIAVMNHPASFRYPTYWHVRDYGLLAANPFGVHEFESAPPGTGDYLLPEGHDLVLKYRGVFHAGDTDQARIADRFKKYMETTSK